MRVFSDWELQSGEIAKILGVEGRLARRMAEWRDGRFLPDSQLEERLEHLIGIIEALRTTFPQNKEMGKVWINIPHRRLNNNQTPLEKIVQDGLDGLVWVRAELDCTFAWSINQMSIRAV